MSKKEVIFFLPDTTGGVSSFVSNLIKYSNSDYFCKVIQYRLKEDKRKKLNLQFSGHEQINFEYSRKDNLFYVLKRLRKYISSDESIIIANDLLELRLVNDLKLKNPLFYIIHGDNSYYYQLIKYYSKMIDRIISVSSYIKKNIRDIFPGIPNEKVLVSYAPVSIIEFKEKDKAANYLNLIFAGNIVKTKGVYLFKSLISNLLNKNIRFKFNIAGTGNDESSLREILKSYKEVIFHGQLSQAELFELYKQSDIFIFPTESEGMPLVIVEAMKAGVVPLCNDIPSGIPEIIKDGETGYKIINNQVEIYAERIKKLYENRSELIRIGKNAVEFANKYFDPHVQSKKYFDLFTSQVDGAGKQRDYVQLPLGGILNKKYLPNFLVRFIRSIFCHPKL